MNKIISFSNNIFVSNSYALGINPIVLEKNSSKEWVRGFITITNSESCKQKIKIYNTPFIYDGKTYQVLKSNNFDYYLFFLPKFLTLNPGESKKIQFNAQFLRNMKLGKYRSIIYIDKIYPNKNNISRKDLIPKIGITFYASFSYINPEVIVNNIYYKANKLALSITNTGEIIQNLSMIWELETEKEIITTNKIYKSSYYVSRLLSKGKKNIKIKLPKVVKLTAGNYSLKGTLFWGNSDINSIKFKRNFTINKLSF